MTTTQAYLQQQDLLAALLATLTGETAEALIQNPEVAEALVRQLNALSKNWQAGEMQQPPPPDGGLAQLIGLGPEAASQVGLTNFPPAIETYDETVTSERILAVGDLYYLYQHEKIGVFRAILKLQELFRAGTVRLSSGDGAYKLYQFDRKQVLRYTQRERMQAYRRVFGYTKATPPPGAKPNQEFHHLFVNFMSQVAQFFRDKRISEVIRPRVTDPSFGSIAVVRRAGIDLRSDVKDASYGDIIVLRIEVQQLLDEAFRILGSEDVKNLFGADNAWDVIEEVMKRYLNQPRINASPRNRMAIAGRTVLQWLAQPHILEASRAEFEALLVQIGDEAEEWLTSAESLGIAQPRVRAGLQRNGHGPRAGAKEAEWAFEFG